jgi:hypothetical protein
MRLLVIVEDAFAISGRGVVIAPDVDLGDGSPRQLTVELRRPDGTSCVAEAVAQVPFVDPPRAPVLRHVLRFAALGKSDLPIGTEIWLREGR